MGYRYLYVTEVNVLSWECLTRCRSYINRHSFPGHCEVRVQSLVPNGGNLISDVGYFSTEQLERHMSVSLCVCLFIQYVCCDIISIFIWYRWRASRHHVMTNLLLSGHNYGLLLVSVTHLQVQQLPAGPFDWMSSCIAQILYC